MFITVTLGILDVMLFISQFNEYTDISRFKARLQQIGENAGNQHFLFSHTLF